VLTSEDRRELRWAAVQKVGRAVTVNGTTVYDLGGWAEAVAAA